MAVRINHVPAAPAVYETCTGYTGRTSLNIRHALGVSCMDYCCQFLSL